MVIDSTKQCGTDEMDTNDMCQQRKGHIYRKSNYMEHMVHDMSRVSNRFIMPLEYT